MRRPTDVSQAVITVTMRELDRIKTVQAVLDGDLTPKLAAQCLALSDRQLRRLVIRFRDDGALGMASKKRGRASSHQLPVPLLQRTVDIMRERYADFGPTFACEKLAEVHNIVLAKETGNRTSVDDWRATVGAASTAAL